MIKSDLKSLLPSKLLNGVTRCEGKLYSFLYFVEEFESKRMNSMTTKDFAEYLTAKYVNHVIICDKKRYFDRVIKEIKEANLSDFESEMMIADDVSIDVEDYLRHMFENADDEYLIPFGDGRKTLYEVYSSLKNNLYHELSLEDKKDIIDSMLENIDSDIKKSIIEEAGISLEEYLRNEVPEHMISVDQIKIGNENYDLVDFIKNLVDIQYTRNEEKQEQLNRTKENPALVTEIAMELNSSSELETTLDIPIILSQGEIEALAENPEYSNQEKYYVNQLRRLSNAIMSSSTKEDLDNLKKEFEQLKLEATSKGLSNQINMLAMDIETNLIPKREREIYIFKNNAEDYVDVIMGKIGELKKQIQLAENEVELNEVQMVLDQLEYEVSKRLISDNDFAEAHISLQEIEMMLKEKKNLVKLIPNNSIINTLNEKIIELKKIILNIEYNVNKAEIVGYSIKFEYAKSDLTESIEKAYQSGQIDDEIYQSLMKQVDKLANLEKESAKKLGV